MFAPVFRTFSASPERGVRVHLNRPAWANFPLQIMARKAGAEYWGLYMPPNKNIAGGVDKIVPLTCLENGLNLLTVNCPTEFQIYADVEESLTQAQWEELGQAIVISDKGISQ